MNDVGFSTITINGLYALPVVPFSDVRPIDILMPFCPSIPSR